jgi:two-component system chemotaxis response regulator CheY
MSKNILLVDDSKTLRILAAATLRDKGYTVVEAEDGQKALDILASRSDIAMVISDVNMPGMDGLELLENIRKRPGGAALPVVILTTEARQHLMDRAKAAGAKGWMVKPFNTQVLMAAVQKFAGAP